MTLTASISQLLGSFRQALLVYKRMYKEIVFLKKKNLIYIAVRRAMFKAVKSFYLASYTLKIPQTRITRLSSQYLYQWNATSFFIKTITSSAGFFFRAQPERPKKERLLSSVLKSDTMKS